MRFRFTVFILSLLIFESISQAQKQTLEIVRITDGVYGAIFSEPKVNPVESNSVILIGDEYVVVVDAGFLPATAKSVIAEIRKLTNKPVRYVINSHWHDDHIFGNQVYREAFPRVEFIAHQNTREDMHGTARAHIPGNIDMCVQLIAQTEKALAKGTNSKAEPFSVAQIRDMKERLKVYKSALPELRKIQMLLPTFTFEQNLILHQGKREIQILYFGRGNTRGDVVVHLPTEKILITGDLVVHPVPYAYGSFPGEWIQTLKRLQALRPVTIIPGHGPVMPDDQYLGYVISLLESIVTQVKDAAKRGLSLEQTRTSIDLGHFRVKLAGQDAGRNSTFESSILKAAIEQAYKEAKATSN